MKSHTFREISCVSWFKQSRDASATRGERDKLDLRAGSDFDAGVVAREDRLFVELDDDRLTLKAEAGKQRAHAERALHGMGLTIELDAVVHFHCWSCSGKGQLLQSEKSSRQKSWYTCSKAW